MRVAGNECASLTSRNLFHCPTSLSYWEIVVSHCFSSRKLPPSDRPPAAATAAAAARVWLHQAAAHTHNKADTLSIWEGDTTRGRERCQIPGAKMGAPLVGMHQRGRVGEKGETSRDEGVPLQEVSPPKTRALTHTQTQGRRRRESKGGSPKQRESQRPDKTLAGPSPCWERARSSQLRMEKQPGSGNSLLAGAAVRASRPPARLSRPLSSLRPALPPSHPPRADSSPAPLASPLPPPPPSSPPPIPPSSPWIPAAASSGCKAWLEPEDAVGSSPRNPLLPNLLPPEEVLMFQTQPAHSFCSWIECRAWDLSLSFSWLLLFCNFKGGQAHVGKEIRRKL